MISKIAMQIIGAVISIALVFGYVHWTQRSLIDQNNKLREELIRVSSQNEKTQQLIVEAMKQMANRPPGTPLPPTIREVFGQPVTVTVNIPPFNIPGRPPTIPGQPPQTVTVTQQVQGPIPPAQAPQAVAQATETVRLDTKWDLCPEITIFRQRGDPFQYEQKYERCLRGVTTSDKEPIPRPEVVLRLPDTMRWQVWAHMGAATFPVNGIFRISLVKPMGLINIGIKLDTDLRLEYEQTFQGSAVGRVLVGGRLF